MRKLFAVAALALLAVEAPAAQADQNVVARGRYVLVLHPTSLNGGPVSSNNDLAVPMAVAVQGTTIAMGGKRGPQVVGTITSGHVVATRGVSPTLGQMRMEGTMTGSNSMFGTFSMTTPKGNTVTGQFAASPYGSGWSNGSGSMGNVQTPGGGTLNTNGSIGNVKTPTGGSLGSWSNGSGSIGSIAGPGGVGPTISYQNGVGTLEGTGAPGMANGGPNLSGTSVGGAVSDDGKVGDYGSTHNPDGSKKDSGSGDSGGILDSISNAANSVVNAVKSLDILGGSSGNSGKAGASSGGSSGGSGSGSGSSGAQSGTSLWDSIFGTTNNNPSPMTPVHPKGNHSEEGDRDNNNDGKSGGKIDKGNIGGRGGDGGGSGSTDRGGNGSGGKNAQGQLINGGPNKGDPSPFKVGSDDVLATSHLINPASDPILSGGGAMAH